MRNRRFIFTVAILAALIAGYTGGVAHSRYQQAKTRDAIVTQVVNRDGPALAVDFNLFWQVWDRLHDRFVDSDSLDAQKLVYGAISGMVDAAGDPYTVFMEPVTTRQFQEDVEGSFSGIGIEVGKRDGAITVIAPINDSPAYHAGLKAGDVILKVDGAETDEWTVEEAVRHIRGQKGTTVHLTLFREGEEDILEFDIVRNTIRIPAVEWKMLDGKVAYIQIFSFNANVDEEFAKASREIVAAGAQRIILDVRNNPGGFLDSAVSLSGSFLLPNSLVVQEKFSDDNIDELRSSGTGRFAQLPAVILINGGSASASEIVAGALHDIRAIRLVGEKTYGKGSVQQIEGFYNGSSLKVTIAKWLTPNGISISDTGIVPTDEVILDPSNPDADNWMIGTPGKDPQLDRAIEIITSL
jgi:carboxyl-terminal processing protease